MSRFRVLVIGAYGQFGRRIAATLAGDAALELVLAGRNPAAADALAAQLRPTAAAAISTATLDVESDGFAADGSAPQIPATAAVVLARKLARDALPGGGARPCLDLFTLDEFMQALEGFPIRAVTEARPATSRGNARVGRSTAVPR